MDLQKGDSKPSDSKNSVIGKKSLGEKGPDVKFPTVGKSK